MSKLLSTSFPRSSLNAPRMTELLVITLCMLRLLEGLHCVAVHAFLQPLRLPCRNSGLRVCASRPLLATAAPTATACCSQQAETCIRKSIVIAVSQLYSLHVSPVLTFACRQCHLGREEHIASANAIAAWSNLLPPKPCAHDRVHIWQHRWPRFTLLGVFVRGGRGQGGMQRVPMCALQKPCQ